MHSLYTTNTSRGAYFCVSTQTRKARVRAQIRGPHLEPSTLRRRGFLRDTFRLAALRLCCKLLQRENVHEGVVDSGILILHCSMDLLGS